LAGTDRTRSSDLQAAPAVILVVPQLGENIGMAARAMLNCGLTDLRLVRPRDGWPSDSATAASSGADIVIDNARVFETTEAAIADLTLVYATTARDRAMTKRVLTPEAAAREMREKQAGEGARVGILFGGEAKGLNNDDVALADHVITAPLNPGFSSLNLAQAVLIISWEWRKQALDVPAVELRIDEATRPATKQEMNGLFEHLERSLDTTGFFHVVEKRPIMARNLRNILSRAAPTEQEVRTLRGVISSFMRGWKEK
jgi:tRNA/rRNA methyltransferase